MSLVDDFFNDRQSAREQVVGLEDNNPDEAARAIELSRVTGTPSIAVVNDIPGFEKQARDQLATDIINENVALQNYVNSNPMAARISSDDWGNLDGITKRTGSLTWYGGAALKGIQAYMEGMREQGHIGSWLYNTPEKAEWAAQQPRATLLAYTALGLPIEAISRIFGPVPGAAKAFIEDAYGEQTGDYATGQRLGREVAGYFEYVFNKPPTLSGPGPTAAILANRELRTLADSTGPYIRAGVEPPIGLHPALDDLKIEQVKRDLEELQDVTREVQQSTTRERSPEMFADLLRQQTQANIYIPFDAVVKLYGEKPIKPDDGVLGWVPGIQEQVRTMSMTGGDIVIPLADWLAKSDKDVAKDLHDNIRVRRGGFTIEEAKEYGEVRKEMASIDVFHGSPHSFDAFSMERIGTGEGAQSYGHGLYFAENRQVAESYAVGRQTGKTVNTGPWVPGGADIELMEVKKPSMYRARIRANPEDFLDWDKPLAEQPPKVQEALQRMGAVPPKIDYTQEQLANRERLGLRSDYKQVELTGEEAYRTGTGRGGDKETSRVLREAGIPGIRYLDQGSRQRIQAQVQEDIRNVKLDIGQTKLPELVDEIEKRTKMDIVRYRSQLENKLESLQRELEGAPREQTYNYVLFDDALVEILDRNGEAINAVRQQAGLEPLAMATEQARTPERTPIEGEEIRRYSKNTTAYVIPKEDWHPIEKIIDQEVDKLLKRIAPTVEHTGAQELEMKGMGKVQGAYLAFNDRAPIILWALDAKDPFQTARHEAIHFLRDNEFFTPAEWEILRKTAIEENWIDKHRINERGYKDLPPETKIEEAIAEEYSKWAQDPKNVKASLHRVFEKLHMLLVEIKEAIQKALGFEPKVEELFQMVESGEIGSRTGQPEITRTGGAKAQAKETQDELDVTRQEDKPIFRKPSDMGFTVDSFKRYMAGIAKRNAEDIAAQRERAIAFEKKRQSLEWRQESEEMEDGVRSDLRNRPDIAATEFFRYGELYGQKVDGPRPKIDEALLTNEERKLLPANWLGSNGLHPDDAASLFGYASRGEFLERVSAFEAQRGNIRPGEFLNRLVKAEVERRMIEKHGELDANILAAAEDHVLGVTQMDLLHEETVALGSRSGAEISFSKEDVQGWAQDRFNESVASKVSAVRFLDEAGKAGRAAELALLKGDFAEAFRQKQRQYLSALMAKEAKGFEKETARFDRLANRFSRREGPKAVEQEFTDQIQALLLRAELPVRRTGEELQEAFDRAGYRNLDEFVSAQVADGWELAVQPYLAGQIKAADAMSVQEAREFRAAIASLNHVGREVKSIELAGVKEDFAAFKEKVLENIKTLPFRPKESQGRWFYKWDAMQTKMEEIVKDLDLRKELGPLFDALIRPMAEAKHQEYSMLEKLAAKFTEIRDRSSNEGWQKTLSDDIPQNFFYDPNGTLFNLSRQDMLGIMLNLGNKSNIKKFVEGWRGKGDRAEDAVVFENKLRTMIDQNATKADWDWVQNIWDMFDMWKRDANEMYYQLSGVPPKWIEPQAFTNAHGNYRGGYFPVIYDKYWSGIEAKAASRTDVMFGQNYHRATPANHYTKERTGYTDFVEFQGSIEQVAARMQQEIHDISYRRPLIAAKKVISDKEIRAAIRQHYGSEYEAQMTPWMQKIASHYQMDEQAVQGANALLRRIRYNLIGHALPLNLKVLLSPSTGLINPVSFGSMLWNRAENAKVAYENSKEIPHTFRNMDRDFRERLEATINAKGFTAFQADVLRATFWPAVYAEQQFRIKTFATEYQKGLTKGLSEGDAVALADSVVRERHGSAGLPDLPAIMSSNEAMKTYTMFYGFFNTMYNWQRQLPGQARRGEYSNFLKTLYGAILVPSAFGAFLFNQQKEGDSWFKTIGKALLLQPLATAVFAREVGSAIIEGFPSRTGLGGLLQSFRTSAGDVEKVIKGKEVPKPIQHTANVVGLSTGLPLAQIGRTGQFSYDVSRGKQRPRNFTEWFRGVVTGEARLKK